MAHLTGRLLFVVTEDWAFLRHRLPMAMAAVAGGFEVAVATRVSRHGDAIREHGIQVYHTPLDRAGLSPLRDIRYLLRLVAVLRAFRPGLIHNVASKPILYGTMAARLAAPGARIINAFTGLGILFTEGARTGRAKIIGGVLLAALRVLCRGRRVTMLVQNSDDRAFLAERGIGGGARTALIPGSGVDTDAFRPTPEPGAGPVRALFVGRLLWTKGLGELAAAARILKDRGRDIRFVLVGAPDPGNPTSVSAADIEAWVRDGLVEWQGERSDIAACWAGAHIAVLPSWREGMPKSLLEAAACGRPMVATDVPGCRDLVRSGETGLLVPRGDAAALADAVDALAADPARRTAMGANARRDAETRFSAGIIGQQTQALYRNTLAGEIP